MDPLAWALSATGFALAMTASPGPNNAMVAASAANFGIWRSLPHILGVALGFPLMLVLVALGAAQPLQDNPQWQALLRWVGAGWMLWLAVRIATAAPAGLGAAARGRPMTLVQAALFQWVNPKAWVIAAGAVTTFAGTRAGIAADAVVLAVLFGLIAFACLLAWAALGLGLARLLRSPGRLRWFNRAMGLLLAASVVPMLAG